MNDNKALRPLLDKLDICTNEGATSSEQFKQLVAYINDLINHDFNKLVAILYRVDVPEMKMRPVLAKHSESMAAEIIATMLINREAEKMKYREMYRQYQAQNPMLDTDDEYE